MDETKELLKASERDAKRKGPRERVEGERGNCAHLRVNRKTVAVTLI